MERERNDEELENALCKETLKLPVKPACVFALAIPAIKAAKPDAEMCFITFQRREQ